MGNYSVAEAKNRLPALLSAVERGESVTITRYGKPIAEIRPISTEPRRVTSESIDWIEQQLADLPPLGEDAGTLIEALRAEDDH
jgi:prevent-host-death family protein